MGNISQTTLGAAVLSWASSVWLFSRAWVYLRESVRSTPPNFCACFARRCSRATTPFPLQGIANVIVTPDLYDRDRLVVIRSKFLLVEGPLQNQDNVIDVKATRLTALSDLALEVRSHDFH